jgi:hypothetical protein
MNEEFETSSTNIENSMDDSNPKTKKEKKKIKQVKYGIFIKVQKAQVI